MAFFIITKKTEKVGLFGSIPVMRDTFPLLKKVNLEYYFSRKKLLKYENEDFIIYRQKMKKGNLKKKYEIRI